MAKGRYVTVGSTARKVKKRYLTIDGKTRKVKKRYVVVGGVTKLVWSGDINKFVAVGDYTSIYSDDGINWTIGNHNSSGLSWGSSNTSSKENIVYGNGRYVASYGTYSLDGITWTVSSNPTFNVYRVFFMNGKFFGSNGSTLEVSSDGVTLEQSLPLPTTIVSDFSSYGCLQYHKGKYVMTAGSSSNGKGFLLYSTDSTNWTISVQFLGSSSYYNYDYNFHSLIPTYRNPKEHFVFWLDAIVSENSYQSSQSGTLYTSTDGINWTTRSGTVYAYPNALINGYYYRVTTGCIYRAPASGVGALSWTQLTTTSSFVVSNVFAWNADYSCIVVPCTSNGYGLVYSTDNGATWKRKTLDSSVYRIRGICYGSEDV